MVVGEGVNVGTVTEAVAPGDFAIGLTGENRIFYDQSAALITQTNRTALTNTWDTFMVFEHETTGTPAVGFGGQWCIDLQASAGVTTAACWRTQWTNAGAPPTSDTIFLTKQTGVLTEAFRMRGVDLVGEFPAGLEVTTYLRVGSSSSATATGDLSAGDGTREMFWDASAGVLSVIGPQAGGLAAIAVLNDSDTAGAGAQIWTNLDSVSGYKFGLTSHPASYVDNGLSAPLTGSLFAQGLMTGGIRIVTDHVDAPVDISTDRVAAWRFQSSTGGRHFVPVTDNTYDIGSGTNRVRNLYVAGSITGSGASSFDYLNVGTTTEAVATGDLASGVSGANRIFYDQSGGFITSTRADAGTTSTPGVYVLRHETTATPAAGFGASINWQLARAPDMAVVGAGFLAMEWTDATAETGSFRFGAPQAGANTDAFFIRGSDLGAESVGPLEAGTYLRVGASTAAVGTGDFSAGDGTREMFWDASAGTMSLSGISTTSAVNPVDVTGSSTGSLRFSIENTSAGSLAKAVYTLLSNTSSASLFVTGSGHSTTGNVVANGTYLASNTSAGLFLGANNSAPITLFTGGTDRWQVNGSGHFLTETDNSYDIGASGATRPRRVYVGTEVVVGSTVTISTDSIDASGALTIGGSTATALTLGRSTLGVSTPGWMNIGSDGSATALGDFSAGVSSGDRMIYDQSVGRLLLQKRAGSTPADALQIFNAEPVNVGGDLEYAMSVIAATATSAIGIRGGISLGYTHTGGSGDFLGAIVGYKETTGGAGVDSTGGPGFVSRPGIAGAVLRWRVAGAGHFIPHANSAYDIGSSSNRIRDIYSAGSAVFDRLNVGTTSAAVATGDLAAGDGTRSLVWSSSTSSLTLQGAASNNSTVINPQTGWAMTVNRTGGTSSLATAMLFNARSTTGGGSAGLGTQIAFQAEADTDGQDRIQGTITYLWRDPTTASAYAQTQFGVVRGGVQRDLFVLGNTTTASGNARAEFSNNAGNRTVTIDMDAESVQVGQSTSVTIGTSTVTGSGALTLDSATTGAVSLGTGASAKTVTIGTTTGAAATIIQAGTGGLDLANSAIANTVNLGTGAAAKTVNLGSTTGASTTTIQAGSGGLNLGITSASAVNIGNTSQVTDLRGGWRTTSEISPAALPSGNTNDYNPTGLGTAAIIRLQGNATTSVLTGIVAQNNARRILLVNVSTNAITLSNQNAASAAANRFACPNAANYSIQQQAAVEIFYDATTQRWRLVQGA